MKSVFGVITARGGSKRLPSKNIKELGGKPLIVWTIEVAQRSSLERVIVSTEDQEISRVSKHYGAEVPFLRPASLAGDSSPHVGVVTHAIKATYKDPSSYPDYTLLLQPTSPFRRVEDITEILNIASIHDAEAVVSVCEPAHHPYLCKVVNESGRLNNLIEHDIAYQRAQNLPKVYGQNGAFYLVKTKVLIQEETFFPEKTYPYLMPVERSLDVDTEWDFKLAEMIVKHNALDSL